MLDTDFTAFDVVLDEVVSDIDVLGAFAAGGSSVGFQKDGALVVLISDSLFSTIALLF
jgi:hypothetical protein